MIKITLHEYDRQQLAHTCKTPADRRLRHRCQAILMADRGRRHHQIAADLRVTPRTLQRWLNAYRMRGLAGLTIPWAPGPAPRIPESLAPEIVAWTAPIGPRLNSPPICTRRKASPSASAPGERFAPNRGCARIARPTRTSKVILPSRKRHVRTWRA